MKKLSLIIPVYNVESYVAKCITSCIDQNLSSTDYEIIIIDDGSTDNSLKIVNNIAENQGNITVVSQKNEGLSLVRNKGLELAQGEYVWFVDSDDWIESNCLDGIIKQLNQVDVLAIPYNETYDDTAKNNKVFSTNIIANSGIDLLQTPFPKPAQFYIYRKSFLKENNLFFVAGIFHEDFEFTPRMLYFAKKIAVYEKQVYYYYQRSGSITNSLNSKKSFDLIKIAIKLISFEKDTVIKKDKYVFHNLIWLALNNALFHSLVMDKMDQNKFRMELYNKRWMFKYLNLSTVFKYRIERILFVFFPKNTIHVYKFLKLFKRL